MTEIRLIPAIILLKRTPAEKLLLAHICQRTVDAGGSCPDSNGELAQAVGMHPQTVSDLVNRLNQVELILPASASEQLTKRLLIPTPALLEAYQQSTPPNHQALASGLSPKQSVRPTRLCPVTGIDITHQRENMKFASRKTLARLLKYNRNALDEILPRFLTPEQLLDRGSVNLIDVIRKRYNELNAG